MLIQLKKAKDGPPTLACVRPDGSRTWATLHPFFPNHDLTHCAVESVLAFTEAFFGLVASGWHLDDFSSPRLRSRLPAEAIWAESIVGLFDLERGMGRVLSAEGMNTALRESLQTQGVPAYGPLSAQELEAIRSLRGQLLARWDATAPGQTLEVPFPYAPARMTHVPQDGPSMASGDRSSSAY